MLWYALLRQDSDKINFVHFSSTSHCCLAAVFFLRWKLGNVFVVGGTKLSFIKTATLLKSSISLCLFYKEANTAENFTHSWWSPLASPLAYQCSINWITKHRETQVIQRTTWKWEKQKRMFIGTRTWYESADLEKERVFESSPEQKGYFTERRIFRSH